jgi:hypothetical protein
VHLVIYFATVVCPTLPSLRSSPCIRVAPQNRLARLILWVRRRISSGVVRRPPRGLDFQRKYAKGADLLAAALPGYYRVLNRAMKPLDAKAKKALIGILDEVDPDDAERRMSTFRSASS